MAYMSKEKKVKMVAALKERMPKGWKWSLRIDHHTSVDMTIQSAPVDLIKFAVGDYEVNGAHYQVNTYHPEHRFESDPEVLRVIRDAIACLNIDNHNNSDIQTDYFDVGHYVHLNVGKWNKPFVVK